MTKNYPPAPANQHDIEIMLEMMTSVTDRRNAAYLSTPLTTGKRFVDWRKQKEKAVSPSHPDYRQALAREVIEPNRRHARQIVAALRGTLACVLIDPTSVGDLKDWGQGDYLTLWTGVIERYADTVIFADDWEYSNGCAYEFLAALRSGAATRDERQKPLNYDEGCQRIACAIQWLEAESMPTEFLSCVHRDLKALAPTLRMTSVNNRGGARNRE